MTLPAEPFRPRRADWLRAVAVAVALFALYAATAPRTVALEDDGLFILSSYFLGIEHPPGYPLFTLIGHLFTYLPFGSVAYRVHLASALFGALTGGTAWLCARSLISGRLPAYLAALGARRFARVLVAGDHRRGLHPQYLLLPRPGLHGAAGLPAIHAGTREPRLQPHAALDGACVRAEPEQSLAADAARRPAFLVLLWPRRRELLSHFGALFWLVILGLLPYAWMVHRSWAPLPINFDGPLETIHEVYFFVSRAGYADVDHSVSADWLDRIKFFQFFGGQLLVQFAVLGTLLAAAGFVVQWRILGRRMAAFLTVAFLMPSAVLLLLLGFDYDSYRAHIVSRLSAACLCDLRALDGARIRMGGTALRPAAIVRGGRGSRVARADLRARCSNQPARKPRLGRALRAGGVKGFA